MSSDCCGGGGNEKAEGRLGPLVCTVNDHEFQPSRGRSPTGSEDRPVIYTCAGTHLSAQDLRSTVGPIARGLSSPVENKSDVHGGVKERSYGRVGGFQYPVPRPTPPDACRLSAGTRSLLRTPDADGAHCTHYRAVQRHGILRTYIMTAYRSYHIPNPGFRPPITRWHSLIWSPNTRCRRPEPRLPRDDAECRYSAGVICCRYRGWGDRISIDSAEMALLRRCSTFEACRTAPRGRLSVDPTPLSQQQHSSPALHGMITSTATYPATFTKENGLYCSCDQVHTDLPRCLRSPVVWTLWRV